jgi:hypothetical protein
MTLLSDDVKPISCQSPKVADRRRTLNLD